VLILEYKVAINQRRACHSSATNGLSGHLRFLFFFFSSSSSSCSSSSSFFFRDWHQLEFGEVSCREVAVRTQKVVQKQTRPPYSTPLPQFEVTFRYSHQQEIKLLDDRHDSVKTCPRLLRSNSQLSIASPTLYRFATAHLTTNSPLLRHVPIKPCLDHK